MRVPANELLPIGARVRVDISVGDRAAKPGTRTGVIKEHTAFKRSVTRYSVLLDEPDDNGDEWYISVLPQYAERVSGLKLLAEEG